MIWYQVAEPNFNDNKSSAMAALLREIIHSFIYQEQYNQWSAGWY